MNTLLPLTTEKRIEYFSYNVNCVPDFFRELQENQSILVEEETQERSAQPFRRKPTPDYNSFLNEVNIPPDDSQKTVGSTEHNNSEKCLEDPYTSPDENKKKLRALHIEDEEQVRYLVKSFLKDLVELDFAGDGKEAIQRSSKNQYDLIITDINLGEGIDGIEAAREIKNMSYYKNIPIIAATANAAPDIKSRCLKVGMDAFLLKPFLKKDLINMIDHVTGPNRPSDAPAMLGRSGTE